MNMAIDYLAQSETYRPKVIETLLIGEAPPPNGKAYFYLPVALRNSVAIERDQSLPATIFHHYFQRRPVDEDEYREFLWKLKELRVFLVDIVDEPIKVRGSPEGVQRIVGAIPKLRAKLERRNMDVADERITFLLARTNYQKRIKEAFPASRRVRWIDFRMGPSRRGA